MTNHKYQTNYKLQFHKLFLLFVICGLFIVCNLWFVICGHADELRDIRPPVDYPSFPWMWWLVGLIVVVGIIAILWWLQQKRSKAESALSPSMKALKALEALLQQSPDHLAYLKLSSIVRQYLNDRFGLKAIEMTTDEFIEKLPQFDSIPSKVKELSIKLLKDCDMVKFAKGAVSVEQFKHHCGEAVDIINFSSGEEENVAL